jgi:RNA polymerase sigma-70 factor (ECF subfamily)
MLEFHVQQKLNKLARCLQNGDRKAGEQLFDLFAPKIFGFFICRLRHRETAEDLTQEVFLKVAGKIKSFNEGKGGFSAWTWQIAKNTLTDHFRQKRPINFSELDAIELDLEASEKISTFRDPADISKLEDIFWAIKKLEVHERELAAHYYFSDLSYRQISIITKKSEGALRVAIYRINGKLKKLIYDQIHTK